ncbi:potassium channel family protein [Luteipulveratus mongoliensis]|uniref:Potassium transporter n=1 Tax=Luteipulveratus mongoliensis TaxID=571913 RepID=A0A0K1JHF8_9MICO|nr:TrkA family potassium uptake protein [Luteipulveratus mongoliensis]AKU16023.1 potassium transporter [Luteipulveratus mongoliensis]
MPVRSRRPDRSRSALVVGLGRFGTSVASSLVDQGWEVIAVDESQELVQRWSDAITFTVQADTTDQEALEQLGAGTFDRAVVAIGTDIEASVLTVVNLVDIGVSEIWAKAINSQHARILQRIGAHHVVLPESAMGARVAHMLTGSMTDYLEFDDGFAIARTTAPPSACGRTLAESALRTKFGITVVGVKASAQDFDYARPETVVRSGEELVICGPTAKVDAFCAAASAERAS